MNDAYDTDRVDNPDDDDANPAGVAVPLGPAQTMAQDLPVLQAETEAPPASGPALAGSGQALSTVGSGMLFTGTVLHPGLFTLAGELKGSIEVGDGQVTITESGRLEGDAHARTIAVFGHSHGTLDAAGGRVSLHDTAVVSGKVRYAHLQVNGADLNAQLERALDGGTGGTSN